MEYQYRHNYWAHVLHSANPGESRARLLSDLFPYFLGRHWRDPKITQVSFDSFAVGGLVLAIALYGIWRGRGSDRWFLLAVVIFGVAARMALPFFAALTRPIPGLNIALDAAPLINHRSLVLSNGRVFFRRPESAGDLD